jgi:hypothetical protein
LGFAALNPTYYRRASGNFYAIFICAAVSCLSGKRNPMPANLEQGLP